MMHIPRRRLLLGAGALAAYAGLSKEARPFWQSRDSNYDLSTGGAAPSTTTWDPANKFQITLGTGAGGAVNLSATNSVGVGQFGVVRSVSSQSTGKFYVEWTITATDTSAINFGICNASQPLSGSPFLGSGVNNAGASSTNGSVAFNGGSLGLYAGGALVVNDVVGMAIDVGGALFWFRRNAGNWNNAAIGSQNPATGTGGYSTSVTGALFLFADVQSTACTGVLNAGGSAYANAAPSSFGSWT